MMRRPLDSPRPAVQHNSDRGDAAIEAVVVVPLLIAIALVFIAGVRLSLAAQKTDAAAQAAARAASLERTPTAGQSAARAAASDALGERNQACTSTRVTVDTSGLGARLGQISSVTVTVTCTVPLGDLLLFGGGPGVRTMTSSFTSIVDAYRERG
ncbi:TadE/TadG family type IV pilus assembly protein [Streptomyces flavochromogenes]|uniref:TadE/TadG family type IV pilus assembly protein n=1 Tax=Streptomyces flavochromogenes TaxID=68199 RepID=A0ABW6XZ73_9ACTN